MNEATDERRDELRFKNQLRTMQIIAIAMLLGVCVFSTIVVFQVSTRQNDPAKPAVQGELPLSYLAAGALAVLGPLAFLLPGVIERSALKKIAVGTWTPPQARRGRTLPPGYFDSEESKLLFVRQTSLIIGMAMLEGTGFFGCMAYMVSGQPLALGVIGGAIFLMLCKFPTAGRLRNWLELQAARLTDLRRERDVTPR